MKVVALVSGGKDSCYAMMRCLDYGHEIVALANLLPLDDSVDELDSFMYQTVGHQILVAFSQCMGLPLFRRRIHGTSRAQELRYTLTKGDEVEDLFLLLKEVQKHFPSLGGVSSGAIASDYQRTRVENVCSRLGLVSLAFLWKLEQTSLLQQMITSGIQAILVKVAAIGLDPHKHLGKHLAMLQPYLAHLKDLYGINVCGEGGEYETLALDCPLFKNFRILLDEFTIAPQSPDNIAPVGILHPLKFHLEPKSEDPDAAKRMPSCPWVIEVEGTVHEETLTEREDMINCMPLKSTEYDHHLTVIKQRHGFVTISCRGEAHNKAIGADCVLGSTLTIIQAELQKEDLDWGDVFYVHLYLSNMGTFVEANRTYVQHITENLCVRGVPSRSTIEVPIDKCDLGGIMVEVIASKDRNKRVLHVQSISCWAPSCIGPYSQATMHKSMLYMAGQLGLDPPTMALVLGGAGAEMKQALLNCEAVAQVFLTSARDSAVSILVYCSSLTSLYDREEIEGKLDEFLATSERASSVRPLILYIQVPALPKGALLEIEPYLYAPGFEESPNKDKPISISIASDEIGLVASEEIGSALFFEDTSKWVISTCEGSIVTGKCCRVILSLRFEARGQRHGVNCLAENPSLGFRSGLEVMLKISLRVLSRFLDKASFCWDDIVAFRVFFVAEVVPMDTLIKSLDVVFCECNMSTPSSMLDGSCKSRPLLSVPQPFCVPVLGMGCTPVMQDLVMIDLLGAQA